MARPASRARPTPPRKARPTGPREARAPGRARAPRAEAIDRTYAALRRTIGAFHTLHRVAGEGDLTTPNTILLRILAKAGRMSPKELADILGLTQGTITTALNRLEAQGYVQRERSTEDRRVVFVTLTPLATRAMDRIEGVAKAQMAQLFEGWPVEDIQTLQTLLDKLADSAREGCA